MGSRGGAAGGGGGGGSSRTVDIGGGTSVTGQVGQPGEDILLTFGSGNTETVAMAELVDDVREFNPDVLPQDIIVGGLMTTPQRRVAWQIPETQDAFSSFDSFVRETRGSLFHSDGRLLAIDF